MSSESDELLRLQQEVQRLFRDLVYQRHPTAHFCEPAWAPAADLVVSDQSARVILELAGVPRENVRVQLLGHVLEITGRRHPPHEPSGAHYHRAEIFFGEFRRRIELPWDADEASIQAKYRDGMLEIHVVAAPQAVNRSIPVEHRSSP